MLLVGLVSFLSSNAQELHLGATVAGEINTPSENKAKLGYSVGIKGEWNLADVSKGWFVEASAMFKQRNWKSGEYAYANDESHASAYWAYSTYSVEIPVNVGYKFPISHSVSLFAVAGPYFDVGLTGKDKAYVTNLKSVETQQTVSSNVFKDNLLNRSSCGVGLKAGLQIAKHYQVHVSYMQGFSKMFKSTQGIDGKNRDVQIGFSYVF